MGAERLISELVSGYDAMTVVVASIYRYSTSGRESKKIKQNKVIVTATQITKRVPPTKS